MAKYFNNPESLDSIKKNFIQHKKSIRIPMGCAGVIENLSDEDAGQLIKAIVALYKHGDDSYGKALKNEQSAFVFQMFTDLLDFKFSQRYMRSMVKNMNQSKSE